MANAGSCKIGLSPRPSVGVGNKYYRVETCSEKSLKYDSVCILFFFI